MYERQCFGVIVAPARTDECAQLQHASNKICGKQHKNANKESAQRASWWVGLCACICRCCGAEKLQKFVCGVCGGNEAEVLVVASTRIYVHAWVKWSEVKHGSGSISMTAVERISAFDATTGHTHMHTLTLIQIYLYVCVHVGLCECVYSSHVFCVPQWHAFSLFRYAT